MSHPASILGTPAEVKAQAADIARQALRPDGHVALLPAEFWRSQLNATRAFAFITGRYGFPTVESIAWLREQIAGRKAIEIAAGAGDFAFHLGIPATDSKIQDTILFALLAMAGGRPPAIYGRNVEQLEALEAVATYSPQVVIASWVTQWFDPAEMDDGPAQASIYGVKELELLAAPSVETYIVIGNMGSHGEKLARRLPHEVLQGDHLGLVSRSARPQDNCIFVWHKNKEAEHDHL